ncbi:Flp family type IVb pilin [Pectobacterium sp. HCp5_1]|uniref:Flp family type IVb pilin n=1 Tax=Pectobacterium sp. HCp5_1 TaxID=3062446 RepID=UPI00293BA33F|nr:Flp family type IVb pilin [Pectobacterium sp. HCp5_1]
MEFKFRSFLSNESGATAIEYGILAALIATAMSWSRIQLGDRQVECSSVFLNI